jgi:lactate dehydrogenase-like 2-hydroxyacid dehydrogenase
MARDAEFLIGACRGGPETRGLVSAAVLAALGPTGTLVNVARGTVVDEAALVSALVSGGLGFAALDVFAHEPNVPEALRGLPNVVLMPHQGSATVETRLAMGQLVVDNLVAHFENRPLPTRVATDTGR